MSGDYRPIDCGLHDRLEAAATVRRTGLLRYFDGHRLVEVRDRLADVFARDGAEFVRTAAGVEVRLDDIVSFDGVVFRPEDS